MVNQRYRLEVIPSPPSASGYRYGPDRLRLIGSAGELILESQLTEYPEQFFSRALKRISDDWAESECQCWGASDVGG